MHVHDNAGNLTSVQKAGTGWIYDYDPWACQTKAAQTVGRDHHRLSGAMTNPTPSGGNLVHRFHLILDEIVGLNEEEIERVEELVQVGEFAVALENLCTQLYEYDVALGADTITAIAAVGTSVGVEDRYWNMLRTEQEAD